MSDSQNAPPPRRRSFWSCCAWLFGVVVLLPLLVHLIAAGVTGHRVDRELARLRARGEPLELRDFAQPPPEGVENAANIYQELFPLDPLLGFIKSNPEFSYSRDTRDTWTPKQRAEISAILFSGQDYFARLDQASRMGACVFPLDWGAGYEMYQPHLAQLRDAGRALRMRSEVDLLRGDVDHAAASCATLLRMAAQIETTPTEPAVLVAGAFRATATRELERVLNVRTPSAAVCHGLSAQLAAVDPTPFAARAVQYERARDLEVITAVEGGRAARLYGSETPSVLKRHQLFFRPQWNQQTLVLLRSVDQKQQALSKPWPDARATAVGAERRLMHVWIREAQDTQARTPGEEAHPTPYLFHYLYGSRASVGAAWIALEVIAYQRDHGAYPDSLAELERTGTKLPLDPYTQRPYHYRREASGFTLWSVGPDMTDNNATDLGSDKFALDQPGYDLVFQVTR